MFQVLCQAKEFSNINVDSNVKDTLSPNMRLTV